MSGMRCWTTAHLLNQPLIFYFFNHIFLEIKNVNKVESVCVWGGVFFSENTAKNEQTTLLLCCSNPESADCKFYLSSIYCSESELSSQFFMLKMQDTIIYMGVVYTYLPELN